MRVRTRRRDDRETSVVGERAEQDFRVEHRDERFDFRREAQQANGAQIIGRATQLTGRAELVAFADDAHSREVNAPADTWLSR